MIETTETAQHYGRVAKWLHWGTGGLLAYGYFTGVDDLSELADPTRFTLEIIFAVSLGLAFLARYLWMQKMNGHTRLPADAPAWERLMSKLAHYGIYAGVGLIVLSGLAIAYGYATPAQNGLFVFLMIGVHEFSLAATAVLLLMHVVGALWHKFVRKDGIWESMMPNWRSNR